MIMNNIDKIDKFLAKRLKLSKEKEYSEKIVNPNELIVSKRIDLIAKLKYIDSYEKKYDTSFFETLYKETIKSFSDGTYNEPGNKNKNSFDKYIKTFNKMIDDIKKNGFDKNKSLIPISKENVIFDGAHRTAICAYYNKKVNTIVLPNESRKYDLNYFEKKCLDEKYLDYLCLEYSKIKDNIYVICLWPRGKNKENSEVENIIRDNFNVIYKKDIKFTYDGLRNFMIQVYKNDNWIGNINNNYKGIDSKVNNCFSNDMTSFYIIEEDDINKISTVKNNIRKKIGIGNHSIHTSDNKNETIEILNMILNNNSINFLNKSKIFRFKNKIIEINKTKELLIKNKVSLDKIVLDGSVVLALYGLRENKDIDAIIGKSELKKVNGIIDKHNDELNMYNESVDDILYNPENYFYYDGLKYISLELLKRKKEKRGENKDKKDIELINSVLIKQNILKKVIISIKIKIKRIKLRLKYYILKILIITKLDKYFKKNWRKIKKGK